MVHRKQGKSLNIREMELNRAMKKRFEWQTYVRGEIQGVLNRFIGERLDNDIVLELKSSMNQKLQAISGDAEVGIKIDMEADGRLVFEPMNQRTQDFLDAVYKNSEHEEKE